MAKKWLIFLGTMAVIAASYQLVSVLTWNRSLQTSLATPIDYLIPFWPGTVIFYLTIYFFWLPALISKNVSVRSFTRIVVAVLLAFGITIALHIIIPSAYPRPTVAANDSFGRFLVEKLYRSDRPNNTFPSSHVVVAATLMLMMASKLKKWGYRAYASWGALISFSTLTVKQHYFFDVLAGFAVAALSVWLVKKLWPISD